VLAPLPSTGRTSPPNRFLAKIGQVTFAPITGATVIRVLLLFFPMCGRSYFIFGSASFSYASSRSWSPSYATSSSVRGPTPRYSEVGGSSPPGPPFKSPVNTRLFSLFPFRGISLKTPICQLFANFRIARMTLHRGRYEATNSHNHAERARSSEITPPEEQKPAEGLQAETESVVLETMYPFVDSGV